MSVQVNLLPHAITKQARAVRRRNASIAAAAALVGVMGALTVVQGAAVTTSEQNLAAGQDANRVLQARVGELAPFADLEKRRVDAAAEVSAAMGPEASVAGILQDLAAVLPPTAELQTLSLTISPEPTLPQAGGTRLSHGRLILAGRVLVGLAPGLERLMLDVERAAAFDNVFGGGASVDEFDVTTFSLDMDLGPEVRTKRYNTDGRGAQ
jgi:hypothetical protein